ncbi:hypothetical protein ACFQY0_21010 [Haloferula chungangensis]|uniref:Uncharacterized protein n=1 Tax=Haloferula chungangensis TaxID=1048331 RepID=A0ABW2LB29_9BACT
MDNYRDEFGEDPPSEAKAFFDALTGDNRRSIIFLSGKQVADGLDPWHTPYEVFCSPSHWLIRSAGVDRAFDDLALDGADDVLHKIPKSRTRRD